MNFELLAHNLCTQDVHIIDNFLELAHYESLKKTARTMYRKGLFRSAKIGANITAQHNLDIRTDEIYWIEDTTNDISTHHFLKQINKIATFLNQTLFLSLTEVETHFANYQPGTFYKKHCDQFATTKSRKISFVYYLNEQWSTDFGGDLTLYNRENKFSQNISPLGNRFICFNSELPHEVNLTHQARYSITGWLKSRI
jgi:SM-20-related protein